jgi:catechol 2,3-dioxygenase-like lactoylglutathione lyase family enzyme
MKLGKIMIFVSDLVKAKDFYCGLLDIPLVNETDTRLDLGVEGCELTAFKCEKDAAIDDYSNVARSVFVFEVASVEDTMSDYRSKGIKLLHAVPAENDFSRYAAFADPFGNIHEILERK